MKLPSGRPPRLDQFGHNPFSLRAPRLHSRQSPDGVVDFCDLARFGRLVQRRLGRPRHRQIRLFLSEYTIPTSGLDNEFNYHVSRRVQRDWIRRAFDVARKLRVSGLGWTHLYDDPPDPNGGPIRRGGLLTYDGQEKPGYRAFAQG